MPWIRQIAVDEATGLLKQEFDKAIDFYLKEIDLAVKFNEPYDEAKLCSENFLPIHAVLFDRGVLEQGIRFDESLSFYEDWDFWVQIAMYGKFSYVDKISACYRNSGACGFGLNPDMELTSSAKAAFFDKWRHYWSGKQLGDIIDAAKKSHGAEKHLADLEDARRQLRENSEQIEAIQSSPICAILSKCSGIVQQMRAALRLFPKESAQKARTTREISNS